MHDLTDDDRARLKEIATGIEALHSETAAEDARFLRKLAQQPSSGEQGLREAPLVEALAGLIVDGFESDFPECDGIDGESSSLAWITDVADVMKDGDFDVVPMLPDLGISDAADRFRAALADHSSITQEGGG